MAVPVEAMWIEDDWKPCNGIDVVVVMADLLLWTRQRFVIQRALVPEMQTHRETWRQETAYVAYCYYAGIAVAFNWGGHLRTFVVCS